ncbi:MAG: hypothetical protein R2932_56135 [Caldilineaceae bacterium]
MTGQNAFGQFIGIGLERPVTIADGVKLTFHNAGHILGAAFIQLDIEEHATGKTWRVVFSGDIGRAESSIPNPPVAPPDADIVIMESTYGDRPCNSMHRPVKRYVYRQCDCSPSWQGDYPRVCRGAYPGISLCA